MIEALIVSRTRIRLLLKFFLNSRNRAYLRSLEAELGESTNGIRVELNRLEKAGLLRSERDGNRKYFRANTLHPLYEDIHSMLRKHLGLQHIVDQIIRKLAALNAVYLTGDLGMGREGEIIDLIFVGPLNKEQLLKGILRTEQLIHRKIRFVLFEKSNDKVLKRLISEPEVLLLWSHKK